MYTCMPAAPPSSPSCVRDCMCGKGGGLDGGGGIALAKPACSCMRMSVRTPLPTSAVDQLCMQQPSRPRPCCGVPCIYGLMCECCPIPSGAAFIAPGGAVYLMLYGVLHGIKHCVSAVRCLPAGMCGQPASTSTSSSSSSSMYNPICRPRRRLGHGGPLPTRRLRCAQLSSASSGVAVLVAQGPGL